MIDIHVVSAFALLWVVVMPTPGANSLMVTHVALNRGRTHLAYAILGNMIGVAVLDLAAILGLAAVLSAAPWARLSINVFGAVYLIWFGLKLLQRSRTDDSAGNDAPLAAPDAVAAWKTLVLGFVTALSNAQAIVFISSIFAVAGILDANIVTGLACIATMVAMNATYLAALGLILTLPRPRAFYQRLRHRLEAIIGAAFIFFGGRLLVREIGRLTSAAAAIRT